MSKPITINKSLRLGCCISQTLFKMYVAKAIEQWKRECKGMDVEINDSSCLNTFHLKLYIGHHNRSEHFVRFALWIRIQRHNFLLDLHIRKVLYANQKRNYFTPKQPLPEGIKAYGKHLVWN